MTLSEEIQHGESRTLEFKAELPRESEKWIKTVVAFANGAGGRIVVGVNDDRQIVVIPK
ncbi:MAG: ATP-binding protein [Bacteroidales bacterium]|nr:ATP-binding protein [Bacteroidales bacterium]